MAATYLDSSAIVKLAIREPESDALRRYLRRRRPLLSSALARTEVLRALLPGGEPAVAAGRRVLERVHPRGARALCRCRRARVPGCLWTCRWPGRVRRPRP